MNDPVFLLGTEAAGVLLIGIGLSAYDQVDWAGDFDWALDWPDHEPGDWPPLIPYWQRIARSRRARELRVRIDPALAFAPLVRSLLEQQCSAQCGLHVISAASRYKSLRALWGRARFVYVHRSAGGDGARQRQAVREWRTVAAEIAPSARLELRYEDLVSAPAEQIARVCEFLGIAYNEALLRHPHGATAPRARKALTCGAFLQRFGAATSAAGVRARKLCTRSLAVLRRLAREDLGGEPDARVEQAHEAIGAQRLGGEAIAAQLARRLRDASAQRAGVLREAIADREQTRDLRARVVFRAGCVRHEHALRNPRERSESSTATENPRGARHRGPFVKKCEESVERS